jgi:hypothetical protein
LQPFAVGRDLEMYNVVTGSNEHRRHRGCVRLVLLNILITLAALGAHAMRPPAHLHRSHFEPQNPQLSDWPPHNHSTDLPTA